MLFFKLFVYIFMAYGLSEMVVFGYGPFGIFEKWRNLMGRIHDDLHQLFTCMMCFPTWAGVFFSLVDLLLVKSVAFTPFNIILGSLTGFWGGLLIVLLDALFTSGICWCIYQVEEYLEGNDD